MIKMDEKTKKFVKKCVKTIKLDCDGNIEFIGGVYKKWSIKHENNHICNRQQGISNR